MTNHYIAFSGGLDSHVLLHFLKHNYPHLKFQAVHINHQLLPEARSWEKHCQIICDELNIPLKIIRVNILKKSGDSLEALAREKRYEAFKKILKNNDAIFTAHHLDDQAETVLLQLFRGAGLRGVSAMPAVAELGDGFIIRPFLELSRDTLKNYAVQNNLNWVEDPSNQNIQFDRNYLRQTIFPLLKKRWPEISKILNRFAKHSAEQEKLLSQKASESFHAEQRNIIRHLILSHKLDLPPEKILDEIIRMQDAKSDKNPVVSWGNNQCRRYKHKLYFTKKNPHPTELTKNDLAWLKQHLPYSLDDKNITIKYRTGGEKIKLKKNQPTKTLKNLFQEWHVPTWERDKIPLIYYKNKLIAITGYTLGEL